MIGKNTNTNIRRQYNLYRVLRAIWQENGVSRKELCEKLNLDKATMSTIVSLLIKRDIVEEIKPNRKEMKPGRKPIGLGIRTGFGYVIGFEIHVGGLKAIIKDMHFETVKKFNFPHERIKIDQLRPAFFSAYSEVKKYLKNKPVIGLGVAVPGVVDHDRGVITNSWELGVINETYDFQSEIFDVLDIPGFIDNDANSCAWGILTKNRTEDYSNFLYTLFSYEPTHDKYHEDDNLSMGLGIVLDGKLYFGPDYTSGEFQTLNYIEDRINQFNMTAEDQAAYKTDLEIQLKVFTDLSKYLALLINFFNFRKIILGGDLPDLIDNPGEILQKAIHENWPYGKNNSCEIIFDNEADMTTASGAAGMFLEQMFTVPELDHSRGAITWHKVFNNLDLHDF